VEAEPKPKCKPCGLHGAKQCKEGHFACSRNIDINKLINRI
jgi:heptosyltransferase-2